MGAEAPITLYRRAPRIQPRRASGRFARLRVVAMVVLLGLYYAVPWVQLDGAPVVWLDLPGRQFHLAGLLLAPQDLIYLTWLLLIAALTLFLLTTLAGRLWCGYACPQTVWTELFLWVEHLCEGDRAARLKLDRASWASPKKLLRRGTRHVAWLALGLFTGMTFVAYFIPARELFPAALLGTLEGWALFWVLFYGFATWGNAGFLREQVCQYMCPYARFQSAMFDRDTLLIAYDARRGEPRKSAAPKGTRGDCVDCSICVQVCPAGIDIRNGLQYECIACAACIDACDSVMNAIGKPRGLIAYGTARQAESGGRVRLFRPRTVAYAAIWLALCGGFVASLAQRSPLQLEVLRDRHALYRELPDGAIENLYTLKLANRGADAVSLRLAAIDAHGAPLALAPARLELAPGQSIAVAASIRSTHLPPGVHRVRVQVAGADGTVERAREATFITGLPGVTP